MSDVINRINEAAAQIEQLQKEITELEASALAHEAQARQDRLRRTEKKKEAAEWTTALRSLAVRKGVEDAQAAALAAQRSAEANEQRTAAALADVERMKAELTELLATKKSGES